MMKTQVDRNDDVDAAKAAVCALFRSENLPPSKVSLFVVRPAEPRWFSTTGTFGSY